MVVVVIAKVFLKLPNLLMLIKLKIIPLPINLACVTLGELLTGFSVKVNLL